MSLPPTVSLGTAIVSLPGAPAAVASAVNVQPTYVTLAPGQQLMQQTPQPSAVLAGTLVQKPPGMAALAAPVTASVVTMQQPVAAVPAPPVAVVTTAAKPAAAVPAPTPPPVQAAGRTASVATPAAAAAAAAGATGGPAAGGASASTAGATGNAATAAATVASAEVLSKQRLHELVKEVDPNEQLDEEVEDLLLQLADDFIETTVNTACQFAKHRKAATVEVKDVQLYLERKWNMWIPGFGTEDVRPYKRSNTTEAHKQRMAIIRKALKKY